MFYSEDQQREFEADQEQGAMTQGQYMSEALYQHSAVYGADRSEDRWVLSPFDAMSISMITFVLPRSHLVPAAFQCVICASSIVAVTVLGRFIIGCFLIQVCTSRCCRAIVVAGIGCIFRL